MLNGLLNHDSEQHSRGGKQPPAVLLDDGADEQIFTKEDSIAPDQVFDDDSEADNEHSSPTRLRRQPQPNPQWLSTANMALSEEEARWEEQRLNDWLRAVYDEG